MSNKADQKDIIIFLNAFWNNGQGMSGGDQMLIQIFKRIRGHFGSVKCYTSIDGREVIEAEVDNVGFSVSPKIFDQFPLIINYLLRTFRALGVVFKKGTDSIYGGSDFFPDAAPAFLYKLFHPQVRWVQCIFHIYPNWKTRPGSKTKNFIAQYLQKFSLLMIKKADIIININYQVREDLIKRGFDGDKIVVNPPGIKFEYYARLQPSSDTPHYEASFLARLNPSKGIFDLIEIWQKVVDRFPAAKLAIIGGGSEEIKKQLSQKANKVRIEKNVDILGFLNNDEAFSIIKKSEVFLLPSHEEGFGIVIAEAMACETPAISWDLPVYREIFEDYSVQVEENDINAFAQKIIELLEDQNKAQQLTKRAYSFVQKYSWDSIAERHLEIIEQKN